MEKKHEMMSLEDSEQLKGRMKFFEQELMKHHHIDPNLYVEYDVKRGLRCYRLQAGQWQTYSGGR